MAYRKKKGEFAGGGCLVQGLGLLLLFVWPIGTLFGVVLLIAGGRMAIKLICSDCGNKVEKTSKLCPTCMVALDK